jgi:hypothetical protein
MTTDDLHPDGTHSNLFFLDINTLISQITSWSFRTSYMMLFLVFALLYFVFILIFALIYLVIALTYPQCINSGGEPIGAGIGAREFGDCFQLSWTTFSTVGYGIIFPATGASHFYVPTGCVGIGIIGSFEAFMGVLFAGFCGAILFGKVLRSQNNAQVFFSDPIVVRFGKMELCGNAEDKEGHDEEQGVKSSLVMECSDDHIPCPSLEFRLMNRLHGVPQGEIVEAKLDCVAILDPNTSDPATMPIGSNPISPARGHHVVSEKSTVAELAKVLMEANAKTAKRNLHFHSTNSKQPHMFTKISLDADEHPFFMRVWFGRHRLDENSPLLTHAARKRVKLAGGHWPPDMNNYQSIKDSLNFRHILVCISGTSNANAASVYAQKVYDRVDVNVGYRFVPMNYHAENGELKTDPYLLNAVYQQRGGGAEPFQ